MEGDSIQHLARITIIMEGESIAYKEASVAFCDDKVHFIDIDDISTCDGEAYCMIDQDQVMVSCILPKQDFRSWSLSYQKNAWMAPALSSLL